MIIHNLRIITKLFRYLHFFLFLGVKVVNVEKVGKRITTSVTNISEKKKIKLRPKAIVKVSLKDTLPLSGTEMSWKWSENYKGNCIYHTVSILLIQFRTVLHLHEIVEGLYFHCSLSLCVCMCVCVYVYVWCFIVHKIPAKRMNRFGRGFR